METLDELNRMAAQEDQMVQQALDPDGLSSPLVKEPPPQLLPETETEINMFQSRGEMQRSNSAAPEGTERAQNLSQITYQVTTSVDQSLAKTAEGARRSDHVAASSGAPRATVETGRDGSSTFRITDQAPCEYADHPQTIPPMLQDGTNREGTTFRQQDSLPSYVNSATLTQQEKTRNAQTAAMPSQGKNTNTLFTHDSANMTSPPEIGSHLQGALVPSSNRQPTSGEQDNVDLNQRISNLRREIRGEAPIPSIPRPDKQFYATMDNDKQKLQQQQPQPIDSSTIHPATSYLRLKKSASQMAGAVSQNPSLNLNDKTDLDFYHRSSSNGNVVPLEGGKAEHQMIPERLPRPHSTQGHQPLRSNSQGRSNNSSMALRSHNAMPSMNASGILCPSGAKQVKFSHKESRSNQNLNPNVNFSRSEDIRTTEGESEDLKSKMSLVNFYNELIRKEREEFQVLLKSKLCVERAEVMKKVRKQVDKANLKFEKVAQIEKNLQYARNNNDRLRQEWKGMQAEVSQAQKRLQISQQENKTLRNKLDDLWGKFDEEKDIVMMVTKQEVEKVKQEEIVTLQMRLEEECKRNVDLEEKLSRMQELESENRDLQNTQCKLKADNQLLLSKYERLELENRRLKKDQELEAQIDELKQKYDDVQRKYQNSSQQLRKMMSEVKNQSSQSIHLPPAPHVDQMEGGDHERMARTSGYPSPLFKRVSAKSDRKSKSQKRREANTEGTQHLNPSSDLEITSKDLRRDEQRKKDKIARKSRSRLREKSVGDRSKSKEKRKNHEVEVWKLRCKYLSEKYFNMIKDLKAELHQVKKSSLKQIEKAKKEMGTSLVAQLQDYLQKVENSHRASREQLAQLSQIQEAPADEVSEETRAIHSNLAPQMEVPPTTQFISEEQAAAEAAQLEADYQRITANAGIGGAGGLGAVHDLPQTMVTPGFQSIKNLGDESLKEGSIQNLYRGLLDPKPSIIQETNLYRAEPAPLVSRSVPDTHGILMAHSRQISSQGGHFASNPLASAEKLSARAQLSELEKRIEEEQRQFISGSLSNAQSAHNADSIDHILASTHSDKKQWQNEVVRRSFGTQPASLLHQHHTANQVQSYASVANSEAVRRFSQYSRGSSLSRERNTTQVAFINGHEHKMAPLRKRTPPNHQTQHASHPSVQSLTSQRFSQHGVPLAKSTDRSQFSQQQPMSQILQTAALQLNGSHIQPGLNRISLTNQSPNDQFRAPLHLSRDTTSDHMLHRVTTSNYSLYPSQNQLTSQAAGGATLNTVLEANVKEMPLAGDMATASAHVVPIIKNKKNSRQSSKDLADYHTISFQKHGAVYKRASTGVDDVREADLSSKASYKRRSAGSKKRSRHPSKMSETKRSESKRSKRGRSESVCSDSRPRRTSSQRKSKSIRSALKRSASRKSACSSRRSFDSRVSNDSSSVVTAQDLLPKMGKLAKVKRKTPKRRASSKSSKKGQRSRSIESKKRSVKSSKLAVRSSGESKRTSSKHQLRKVSKKR